MWVLIMIVSLISRNIKTTFLVVLLINWFVLIIYTFSKDVVLYKGKNAVFKFIQCIFKEYDYCRSVMKKHF